MPLCRIADLVLYFAHIPKTGGSSIEDYMAAKGTVALRHNRTLGWSRTTAQHMPAAVFERLVPAAFYDHGFAVLRDPEARMISTFRMRIGTDHAWRNPLNWLLYAWCRSRGPEVYAIDVWKLKLSLDFDAWVWIVTRWMRRNPYIYDGHCLPQSAYVVPGQMLFLFENGLDPVFRWIDAVTGTQAEPGTFHEKRGARQPVRCSPSTSARLRRVYARDYALIEACRAASGHPVTAPEDVAACATAAAASAAPGSGVVGETAARGA